MAIGDPFGSLDSSPDDWQDQEAQANLAAQNQPESGVSTLWRAIKHPSLLPLIKSLTSSDDASAQPPQNAGDAAMAQYFPEAFTVNPVAQNLATGVAGAIKSGATAPGRALSGELPMYGPDGHTSEEMIDAGNDMAGLAGGGSVAGTLERAAERAPGRDLRVLGRPVALAEDAAPGAAVSVAEHAPFGSLDELRNYWTGQGVRNFVGQHATTGNLQLADLVVPKEARNSGVGTQFMNDLTGLADQQGRTVTLTPDKSYGASSVGRLKDFYKRFGFVENKGRNADYSILDSMYRPPAAALSDSAAGEGVATLEHASEPFYSTLERAVTDSTQNTAKGAQWLATIKNKPGVKPEEMDWTGVKDFLAANADKPVTKDQLLDHLEANKVQIGEVTKGDFNTLDPKEQYRLIDNYADRHDMRPDHVDVSDPDFQDYVAENGRGGTKYSQYQLPGGENYREKLLTLPEKQIENPKTGEQIAKIYGRDWERVSPSERAQFQADADRQNAAAQGSYKSSHWDEPNVLLHTRMTDRPVSGNGFTVQNQVSGRRSQVFPDQASANAYIEQLPESLKRQVNIVPAQDTKKALHLEELQSDWHQEGRKKGYQSDFDNAAKSGSGWDQITAQGRLEKAVPDAPFKKTWHELGLKRALHEAAEGGYDRLSWTPGEAHPTNPKNLGSAGPEAEAANRGMQGFYDKMIPDYLNKVGKPHGVQVKEGTTPTGVKKINGAVKSGDHPVHYIDINPSLRQHVLKGMPLFEDGSAGAAVSAAEHMPALNPLEHDLTVNDILHPDTPAVKAGSRGVEDIAADLDKRGQAALKKLGVKGGRIEEPNPRTDEMLSRAMASEIKSAMDRGGNTATDWYRGKVEEAMNIAKEIHPELNDPHQRMGYTLGLAVTSQGEKVRPNTRLADQVYNHFKQTGRFPTDVKAKNGPAMNANFVKLNGLLDELGPEGTRAFLHQDFTVRDLKKAGYDVGSAENMDTKVKGSTILGSKIGGGFYQNLNGNFDPVTMDLWFMRGWGRLTGTLVGNPSGMEKPTARLAAALQAAGQKAPKTAAKLADAAEQARLAHERDFTKNRALYDSGEKQKSELANASIAYLKNYRGINEQPSGGGHRQWIRSVVNRAREILEQQHGIKMSNADLQATWWYPEKELYAKLGGRMKTEDVNVDYATALRELRDGKGEPNVGQEGGIRPVERGPGPAAQANEPKRGKVSGSGRKKADGPEVVPFGALDAGGH